MCRHPDSDFFIRPTPTYSHNNRIVYWISLNKDIPTFIFFHLFSSLHSHYCSQILPLEWFFLFEKGETKRPPKTHLRASERICFQSTLWIVHCLFVELALLFTFFNLVLCGGVSGRITNNEIGEETCHRHDPVLSGLGVDEALRGGIGMVVAKTSSPDLGE
ncbi:hypothetical protein CDAR_498541 [Caerostris darwini]|uniref:Uncharacterized protein n=1 Tax=Caerostris darwini TaxID=1538125 RepID=A0AAV4SJ41_9ARAC|nr:hypothetical protein CDAR_498541 [Caerostris darwini]